MAIGGRLQISNKIAVAVDKIDSFFISLLSPWFSHNKNLQEILGLTNNYIVA